MQLWHKVWSPPCHSAPWMLLYTSLPRGFFTWDSVSLIIKCLSIYYFLMMPRSCAWGLGLGFVWSRVADQNQSLTFLSWTHHVGWDWSRLAKSISTYIIWKFPFLSSGWWMIKTWQLGIIIPRTILNCVDSWAHWRSTGLEFVSLEPQDVFNKLLVLLLQSVHEHII